MGTSEFIILIGALAGGYVTGLTGFGTGLSRPLPNIWGSLKGWGKHQKRGLFQSFNLSILLFAAASQALSGYITLEVGRWIIFALPGTLAGAWLGRKTYDNLGDYRFDQIVLGLLMLAGISILL